MNIRRLVKSDYHMNYLQLMSQLVPCDKQITYLEFCMQLDAINAGNSVEIYVIEEDGKLIGSGTIMFEHKIIHGLSKVAHIEDIVIDKGHRSGGLGKMLINYLITLAKDRECYKVILNCKHDKIKFYEKCGFSQKNVEMSLYF